MGLRSLIIDTISRSKPKGLAYFYCRYNDPASQKPQTILGSLIAQLCLQDPEALKDATTFHAEHHPLDKLPALATEAELGELLQRISGRFDGINLIVDGLDEVGSRVAVDRSELLRILASLHQLPSTIRTLILSRAEQDIQNRLSEFEAISIAASSADLQLYVAANIKSLTVLEKDRELRTEVFEALIHGAEGMYVPCFLSSITPRTRFLLLMQGQRFFWTVCQVQLLRGLPTRASIRQALKSLPHGLSETYERIFERIDSQYPIQTQRLIQRTLRWLVYSYSEQSHQLEDRAMTPESLVHAISLDEDNESHDLEAIPDKESLLTWLGCLVRKTVFGTVELAHYSIKEFLCSSPDECYSSILQKYLVRETDKNYVVETCFLYLSIREFETISAIDLAVNKEAMANFRQKFPFYHHAATMVTDYVTEYPLDKEPAAVNRMFRIPTPRTFSFWLFYLTLFESKESLQLSEFSKEPALLEQRLASILDDEGSPLHVACSLRLVKTVARLLSGDSIPSLNHWSSDANQGIMHAFFHSDFDDSGLPSFRFSIRALNHNRKSFEDPRQVRIAKDLISANCNINGVGLYWSPDGELYSCSPLYISIWIRNFELSHILVDNGATIISDLPGLYLLMGTFYAGSSHCWHAPWDSLLEKVRGI